MRMTTTLDVGEPQGAGNWRDDCGCERPIAGRRSARPGCVEWAKVFSRDESMMEMAFAMDGRGCNGSCGRKPAFARGPKQVWQSHQPGACGKRRRSQDGRPWDVSCLSDSQRRPVTPDARVAPLGDALRKVRASVAGRCPRNGGEAQSGALAQKRSRGAVSRVCKDGCITSAIASARGRRSLDSARQERDGRRGCPVPAAPGLAPTGWPRRGAPPGWASLACSYFVPPSSLLSIPTSQTTSTSSFSCSLAFLPRRRPWLRAPLLPSFSHPSVRSLYIVSLIHPQRLTLPKVVSSLNIPGPLLKPGRQLFPATRY